MVEQASYIDIRATESLTKKTTFLSVSYCLVLNVAPEAISAYFMKPDVPHG